MVTTKLFFKMKKILVCFIIISASVAYSSIVSAQCNFPPGGCTPTGGGSGGTLSFTIAQGMNLNPGQTITVDGTYSHPTATPTCIQIKYQAFTDNFCLVYTDAPTNLVPPPASPFSEMHTIGANALARCDSDPAFCGGEPVEFTLVQIVIFWSDGTCTFENVFVNLPEDPSSCAPNCVTVQPCDDGNPCTVNDEETVASDGSICVPCAGIVDPTSCDPSCVTVQPCDDGNPCTINDEESVASNGNVCVACAGTVDPGNCDPSCVTVQPCDDGNPMYHQ